MTAINFKELKVHMNMGNVMGNVDWISKDFRYGPGLSGFFVFKNINQIEKIIFVVDPRPAYLSQARVTRTCTSASVSTSPTSRPRPGSSAVPSTWAGSTPSAN